MKCYKARWILTSTGEVLENKALVVDEGKFVDIIDIEDASKFEEKYVYCKDMPVGLYKDESSFFDPIYISAVFKYSNKNIWRERQMKIFLKNESEKSIIIQLDNTQLTLIPDSGKYVEAENMKFLDEYVTYVVNEIKDVIQSREYMRNTCRPRSCLL